MNKLLCFSAIFVASVFLAPVAFADEPFVSDAVILNKYPVLSSDEMKQMPFKASMPENWNPKGVHWELHNPFRDKTVAGIVVTVEYKLPSTDKPVVLEMFIRADCGPLQSTDGQRGCFEAEEIMKTSPTIKLKEVHCTPAGV